MSERLKATFEVAFHVREIMAPHSGYSSQPVSDTNYRNAQFLPTVARSRLVRQVERTCRCGRSANNFSKDFCDNNPHGF